MGACIRTRLGYAQAQLPVRFHPWYTDLKLDPLLHLHCDAPVK